MTIQEVAEFYGCTVAELEYYMSLGGPDPSLFIPVKEPNREELEKALERAGKAVKMAENACCLENQPPTASVLSLCKKVMAYQELSGMRL